EGEPELVADGDDLVHVLAELGFGTVDRVTGLAGKLELTARLESNRPLSPLECDHVFALEARDPTETVGEPFEHRLDAARPVVTRRASCLPVDSDLLVFGADPPFVPRLRAGGEIVD